MSLPRVWRRFKRVIDGRLIKFRIQDMPESLTDNVLKMTTASFFQHEPYTKAAKMNQNKEDIMHMQELWRNYLIPQKLTIVCLKDEDTNLSPEIIGVNFLTISKKADEKPHLPDQPENFLKIYKYVESQYNIYDLYKVDKYLSGFGLCVNENYTGQGVATELLLSRDEIRKKLGLSMTSTQFSSLKSQRSAELAGFQTLKEVKYSDIAKGTKLQIPEEMLNNIAKVMIKVYRD